MLDRSDLRVVATILISLGIQHLVLKEWLNTFTELSHIVLIILITIVIYGIVLIFILPPKED